MYLAVIISFICVITYYYENFKISNTISVNGMTPLIIQHGIVYEDGLIKHYQEYSDLKLSNDEAITSILNSLKGTLLSYDSKIVNVEEDNGDLLLEVNESFFTLNKQENLKIAEALNVIRKIYYPLSNIRIYINNNELQYVPQTNLLVSDIKSTYPNLFSGDAVSGYPLVLIENNTLCTHYVVEKSDAFTLTKHYINSIIFDKFTIYTPFVDRIDLSNNQAHIYLNDVLLTEDEVIDEEVLSDYLILVFMNFDIESVFLYLDDEPYYYRGSDNQILKMCDIVYNLH